MISLNEQVTCLNCWSKFPVEEILWESEHRDLLGDPKLGDEAQLRFLPNRFDIHGNAIDARNEVCRQIACPECHLSLPRSILEREPLFISILGTPSCGKSYYLAALASTLRRDLPFHFRLNITDADAVSNHKLIEYEEHIFLNEAADQPTALADLIPKTQLQGGHYNTVRYGDHTVSYPRPLSFTLDPTPDHPNFGKGANTLRLLCLYDNAGEHFLPGNDTKAAPGTRHLAESSFLLFIFDPTQDPRWHAAMRQISPNTNLPTTRHAGRQEGVLREAANRIRRIKGMTDSAKYDRPLIIILNKADLWKDFLNELDITTTPFSATAMGVAAINTAQLREYSDKLRAILMAHIPEVVYAAESFCETVYYVPASALGTAPQLDDNGRAFIRPSDIRPWQVTAPFLLGISLVTKGLIPKLDRDQYKRKAQLADQLPPVD